MSATARCSEWFLSPLVLFHNFGIFLGSKIILDVEELSDFRNAAVPDEGGNLSARELEQGLDIQVVGCNNELEEDFLIEVHKFRVPGRGHITQVVGTERLLNLGRRVVLDVSAEVDDLLKNVLLDVGKRNFLCIEVIDYTFDYHLSNFSFYFKDVSFLSNNLYLLKYSGIHILSYLFNFEMKFGN